MSDLWCLFPFLNVSSSGHGSTNLGRLSGTVFCGNTAGNNADLLVRSRKGFYPDTAAPSVGSLTGIRVIAETK